MENRVGQCPHCGKAVLITSKTSVITGREKDYFYHICKTGNWNQDNMSINELQDVRSVKIYNSERESAIKARRTPTPVQLIDINIF